MAGTSYSVSDNGTVAYLASLNDTTAGQGVFRTDGKETVVIVRDDIEPPTGGRFTALRPPTIDERRQVVFSAEMTGGAADFGVFRGDGQDLTPVFSAGQIAPGGATFTDFGNPLINRHGLVATFASLANSASREGLFVSDGTNLTAVALDGEHAPKGGSYGRRPGFPGAFLSPIRLNDRGELAFPASLTRRHQRERHLSWKRRAHENDRSCGNAGARNYRNVRGVRRHQTGKRQPRRLHCDAGNWRGCERLEQ